MKNYKVLFKIILSALMLYLFVFSYIYRDREERIEEILSTQMENLKVHYALTQKSFMNIADSAVGMIENDPEIIDILTSFLTASDEEKKVLRHRLQAKLQIYYKALQKLGVLQMHFLDPHNVTIFRMHKPSKYGDDLTHFKYSFRQTNLTKKAMSGFEKGRTAPSYRNVRPLYGKNSCYLGIVDIAFAPEIIQKDLIEISKIYSHFLLKKSIFAQRAWNRNDIKDDYISSIENKSYLEFKYHGFTDNGFKEAYKFVEKNRDRIAQNMEQVKEFSLFTSYNGETTIISFLPLYNIKGEQIAYLVSYTKSPVFHKMLMDFWIVNTTMFFIIVLLASIFYKIKIYNQALQNEKNKFSTLAQYDTLTHLPNRALFFDRIKQAKERALRHHQKFALLFIDLDNFKNVNDTYGHEEGDKVLKYVSEEFQKFVRAEDTLARLGGDEFVIIIEELESLEGVSFVAQKILDIFKKPIEINDSKYYLGASVGISIFPDDSEDISELLRFSDTAMYEGKKEGKGRVFFYSQEMSKTLIKRLTLETEIRDAIKNREFIVYYQPQIDASKDLLIGMEALVRWQHPTKGLVPPSEFISIAEETGLIIELDQLVMLQAMQQFTQWYSEGLNPGKLSLNLSVKQLMQDNFLEVLTQLIEQTSSKHEWLELEVTEGHFISDPQKAITLLKQISDLGILLSIDDFGTGYSSLSYLKKLPIDKLKIDQSFVRDLPNNADDVSIVRAIIALAKSLNLKIIAEGVEEDTQRDFLVENGCVNIQGYFYSKPIPAQEFEKKFLSHSSVE